MNDEIVAVDDVRVSSQSLNDHLERSRIGEAVTLLITREGLMRSLQIVPVGSPPDLINLKKIVEASSEQRQRFEWWLRVPMERVEQPLSAPVVILTDGTFPSHPKPLTTLRNARTLICTDGSADSAIRHDLAPQFIIGDLDSLQKSPDDL